MKNTVTGISAGKGTGKDTGKVTRKRTGVVLLKTVIILSFFIFINCFIYADNALAQTSKIEKKKQKQIEQVVNEEIKKSAITDNLF